MSSAGLISEYQEIFSRIADNVNSGTILSDLPSWLTKNTFLKGRPWSFKDHEFQIGIAQDITNQKVVMKCSQVGLTELQIRLALAYLRVSNGRALNYVLPYTKMAMKISQSRIDPVIEESPALKKSMRVGADSATFKRIGNSILYVSGADKATEAISSPLDRLIIDERDFCRERVLGIYNSRMRHTEEGKEIRDEFSTPTISGVGVSAAYEKSDQKRYLCKCMHCGQWQAPSFTEQLTVRGYDRSFEELEKEDFIFNRYDFSTAFIRCKKCGKELDSSLALANHRKWVARFPGRAVSGYAVKPFDLYKYNRTARILAQFPEYQTKDYYNFVLGEPYTTSADKVNDEIVRTLFTGQYVSSGKGFYVGIDVGKVVYVMVGKRIDGVLHVVSAEKLSFAEGDMAGQINALFARYGFSGAVIDAAPDISLPNMLIAEHGNTVMPCVYTKGTKFSLSLFDIKETDDGDVINAPRTRLFDALVADINKSKIQFMRAPEPLKDEIRSHFQQMVRKEEYNEDGDKTAKWVKLSDADHFLHALAYLYLAIEVEGLYTKQNMVPTFNILGANLQQVTVNTNIGAVLKSHGFG